MEALEGSGDSESFIKLGKIPKRKLDEASGATEEPQYNANVSILDDSYYNCYNQARWPSSSSNNVSTINQDIYNTLSAHREKPKNNQKNIFKETAPDVEDPTLPKELTAMFQPLFCKLCSSQLSSNVMAKLHYKSKNHEKKIRKYLIEYSQKTGEPLHKRAKIGASAKTEEEQNPRWFHCEVCDLPLTGKMHAESHYMGKNHQKAMMGYKPPAGKGYYNSEGKWVRQVPSKTLASSTGTDSFGEAFRKTESIQTTSTSSIISSTSTTKPEQFRCDVCNVAATCQEQIDMHFSGQKHQKKLKQLGLGLPPAPVVDKSTPKIVSTKEIDGNLSVYRTPSGDFYCPTCNLTLNSEGQFKVHLKSKGHMKKSSQKH